MFKALGRSIIMTVRKEIVRLSFCVVNQSPLALSGEANPAFEIRPFRGWLRQVRFEALSWGIRRELEGRLSDAKPTA